MQIQAYEAAIAEEKAAVQSLEIAGSIFDIKRELAQIEVILITFLFVNPLMYYRPGLFKYSTQL